MDKNFEEVNSVLSSEAIQTWKRIYPGKFPPCHVPTSTILRVNIARYLGEDYKSKLPKDMDGILATDDDRVYIIDGTKHPELIPIKYYHNKEPIDWDNLEQSNLEYEMSLIESISTSKKQSARTIHHTHNLDEKMAIIDNHIQRKYIR